ncbi:MAG TPA: NUDIX domain-containing protein [Candidatus Paceibacterota bacterium]
MKFATICFPVTGDMTKNRVDAVFLALKKQKIGAGFLNGWGGKMDEGDESLKSAALREFKEETGGAVGNPDKTTWVGMIDFYREKEHVFTCAVFFVWEWNGPLLSTDEMGPGQRFDVSHLPLDRMIEGDRLWFVRLIAGEKLKCTLKHSADFKEVLEFSCEPLGTNV